MGVSKKARRNKHGCFSFLIKHPILAWVMAILVMLAGAFSFWRLPVSQFPEIALPQIVVSASWPGASAKTMEDPVTQIIEQQISGVDGRLYMEANSDSTGNANIAFTFEHGTDVNIAKVQIQNKVQLAMPMLPEQVQRMGVKVTKSSAGILMSREDFNKYRLRICPTEFIFRLELSP